MAGSTTSFAGAAERFVETRFGRVRCLAAQAPTGAVPALLVHGVGAGADTWLPLLPLLRSVQAIAIDLPGHGRSSGPALDMADGYAACLDDVRGALGLQGVVAIGQSLGGAIAQCYARDHAAHCRGVVIAHSAAHFTIAHERIRQVTSDWPSALEGFAARQVSAGAAAALKAQARRLVALRDPAVLARDLRTCNAFDARPWAAAVQAPVLVVTGDEDAGYGPDKARELQALYPRSQLVVLPSCGHNGVLERPRELAAAIDRFVAGA